MSKMEIFYWQQLPSPMITELLLSGQCDGVVLDVEHGYFSNESLCHCIQVGALAEKKILVRVAEMDKSLIRMSLDMGCSGIILSTVEDPEQAKEFYEYSTYPPQGLRGQGLVRENFWGREELGVSNTTLIPMIETLKGVENIDAISDFPFDYYLVGPYDLSASCGDVGNFESDKFKFAMKVLRKKCRERLAFHFVTDVDQRLLEKNRDLGLMALSMDTLFLLDGVKKMDDLIKGP